MAVTKENAPVDTGGAENKQKTLDQRADPKDTAAAGTEQALAFLEAHAEGWDPAWFVHVAAIDPDSGAIEGRAVHPDRIADLGPWLTQRAGKSGLYFTGNPLLRDPGSKPSKQDVAALAYCHVDLDPEDHKPLEAERERLRQLVDGFTPQPTELIDSGNGYGLFWRLAEPILHNGNTDALEADNRALAAALGADDCPNLDRLMRLPGFMNLPNATKAAKGRSPVPVPAILLDQTGQTYALDDFTFLPRVTPKGKATMPPTGIGAPIPMDDYGLPDEQAALVAGTLPKGTRSEVMHSLLIRLLNDGHSRDDILATICEEPGLWIHYICDKHAGDPEAFAVSELGKAWGESRQGGYATLFDLGQRWVDQAAPAQAEPDRIRFDAKPTTLAELDATDPPQEYAIEPIYPLGVPIEFSGAHGIGKSINGVEQCCCTATGRSWQGLETPQGKSVFASWEDPRRQIMRRVKAWLHSIKDPTERAAARAAIAENLIVLGCDEIDLMLTTKAMGQCRVCDEVIELIVERCQGARLVMLETAALMHGGDELNEDLAQLAKAVKLITNGTGASVVTVRHVSKDAARNRVVDAYVGRGGGSFTGAMRSMVVLVDVPADDVRKKGIGLGNVAVAGGRPVLAFHHAKANYGDKMREPIHLVVMPDGHMEHVPGPDEKQVQSDLLLEWLQENMVEGGISFTAIRKARRDYGNPSQQFVRPLLQCLLNAGHAKCHKVKGRGCTGEVEMWELVKGA